MCNREENTSTTEERITRMINIRKENKIIKREKERERKKKKMNKVGEKKKLMIGV